MIVSRVQRVDPKFCSLDSCTRTRCVLGMDFHPERGGGGGGRSRFIVSFICKRRPQLAFKYALLAAIHRGVDGTSLTLYQ